MLPAFGTLLLRHTGFAFVALHWHERRPALPLDACAALSSIASCCMTYTFTGVGA